MPIRSDQKPLYPGGSITSWQWKAIRRAILERSGQRCEQCGAADGTTVLRWPGHFRTESGQVFLDDCGQHIGYGRLGEDVPDDARLVKIVLTIAHLDHNPANNHPTNLKALCQLCHLRYDRSRHLVVRRRSRYGPLGDLVDQMEGTTIGEGHETTRTGTIRANIKRKIRTDDGT